MKPLNIVLVLVFLAVAAAFLFLLPSHAPFLFRLGIVLVAGALLLVLLFHRPEPWLKGMTAEERAAWKKHDRDETLKDLRGDWRKTK